jgi:hypothetical protein
MIYKTLGLTWKDLLINSSWLARCARQWTQEYVLSNIINVLIISLISKTTDFFSNLKSTDFCLPTVRYSYKIIFKLCIVLFLNLLSVFVLLTLVKLGLTVNAGYSAIL